MQCDLTIYRAGTLAGFKRRHRTARADPLDTKSALEVFRRQADILRRSQHYVASLQALVDVLAMHDNSLKVLKNRYDSFVQDFEHETQLFVVAPSYGNATPVVSVFPAYRFHAEIGGMRWVVRCRASVTACAFQRDRLSKIWWTFEGIPMLEPTKRPTEQQATIFLAVTEQMADAAMALLQRAFLESFQVITDSPMSKLDIYGKTIRIGMADTDDRQIGTLFDALYFADRSVRAIRSSLEVLDDARAGLMMFESFTRGTTRRRIIDRNISVIDRIPGAWAILFEDSSEDIRIAGVGRLVGPTIEIEFLSNQQQQSYKSENYLRQTSAVRPISAMLALDQANKLEALSKRHMS